MCNNADRMLKAASDHNLVFGRDNTHLTKGDQEMLLDISCAIGWNPGHGKPSSYAKQDAWWLKEVRRVAKREPCIKIAFAREQYFKLFAVLQPYIDCPHCAHPAPAFVLDGGKAQFRISCRNTKKCTYKMGMSSAKEHFEVMEPLPSPKSKDNKAVEGEGDELDDLDDLGDETSSGGALTRKRRSGGVLEGFDPKKSKVGAGQSMMEPEVVDARSVVHPIHASILLPNPGWEGMKIQKPILPGIIYTKGIKDGHNSLYVAMAMYLFQDQNRALEVKNRASKYFKENPDLFLEVSHPLGSDSRIKHLVATFHGTAAKDKIMMEAVAGHFKQSIMVISKVEDKWQGIVLPAGGKGPYAGLIYIPERRQFELAFPAA
ncbi:hypothetical protein CBOM_04404 [Ceraceosorus bombacis]|uniref:Uncharacterized protein n=2 Tax=Ceraceosorus bombacis TaxID=401625 RepID=A0A0P1BMC0_9BASI|nr:hypothetical protein CBOM_04404 [Ceraceosorus bombacis]